MPHVCPDASIIAASLPAGWYNSDLGCRSLQFQVSPIIYIVSPDWLTDKNTAKTFPGIWRNSSLISRRILSL
jgi:hypothetical protein